MSTADEELDISSRDFNKLIEIHAKEGYKEGISDGRETEFQSGFDPGFQDGLRAGYATGKLTALNELSPTSTPVAPEIPCECCKPGVLDNPPPLEEISIANRESIRTLEHRLSNKTVNE